jgi:hypothetical protein
MKESTLILGACTLPGLHGSSAEAYLHRFARKRRQSSARLDTCALEKQLDARIQLQHGEWQRGEENAVGTSADDRHIAWIGPNRRRPRRHWHRRHASTNLPSALRELLYDCARSLLGPQAAAICPDPARTCRHGSRSTVLLFDGYTGHPGQHNVHPAVRQAAR